MMPQPDPDASIPRPSHHSAGKTSPDSAVVGAPAGGRRADALGQLAEHRQAGERADLARVLATRQRGRAVPPPAEPAGGPLGIGAEFVTTRAGGSEAGAGRRGNTRRQTAFSEAERRRRAPERVARRYALQDTARRLLPEHRIAHCQITPVAGGVTVNHHAEHGSASYGGLQTCGSMWACPVCAAKIGARRAAEVGEGAAAWRRRGGHIYMLTLTLRHHAGRQLAELHERMNAAYRAMSQGRRWTLATRRYGIVGRITAREHTHGENGWHPHLHVLIFSTDELRRDRLNNCYQWFARRWAAVLADLGESADLDHGADLRVADESAEPYIAKMANAWSLPAEVAGGQHKAGRGGNRTPVQLLADAAVGDVDAGELYREYVAATAGTSWLQWTPGLRDLCGLAADKSDAEVAAEHTAEAVALVQLSPAQWGEIRRRAWRGELLAEACAGDAFRVQIWLLCHGITLQPEQILPKPIRDETPADST